MTTLLLYVFAAIGVLVVSLVLFVVCSLGFIRVVARAAICKEAQRLAMLTAETTP